MSTFNYLLGFSGSTRKVMITFQKDGELDAIAVQKAIGEASFVRDDWHPTIEEYAKFLCQYVAKRCGCEYSCAWADFATTLHIDWADSEAVYEECPLKPCCPHCEDESEDIDEGDCCQDCDEDCDNCTCEGCDDDYDNSDDAFSVGLTFADGKIVATIECYGNNNINPEMIMETVSTATKTIERNQISYTHEEYACAIADAISALCGYDTFVNFADLVVCAHAIKKV